MAKALKLNCEQIETNHFHLTECENRILESIKKSGIHFIRNGKAPLLPGLLSLSFIGQDGEAILHRMDLKGICISTGSACNGENTAISHVLRAIKLNEKYAQGTIRISLGKYNTREDIDSLATALISILSPVNTQL
jgi:cysteine desulfurase